MTGSTSTFGGITAGGTGGRDTASVDAPTTRSIAAALTPRTLPSGITAFGARGGSLLTGCRNGVSAGSMLTAGCDAADSLFNVGRCDAAAGCLLTAACRDGGTGGVHVAPGRRVGGAGAFCAFGAAGPRTPITGAPAGLVAMSLSAPTDGAAVGAEIAAGFAIGGAIGAGFATTDGAIGAGFATTGGAIGADFAGTGGAMGAAFAATGGAMGAAFAATGGATATRVRIDAAARRAWVSASSAAAFARASASCHSHSSSSASSSPSASPRAVLAAALTPVDECDAVAASAI